MTANINRIKIGDQIQKPLSGSNPNTGQRWKTPTLNHSLEGLIDESASTRPLEEGLNSIKINLADFEVEKKLRVTKHCPNSIRGSSLSSSNSRNSFDENEREDGKPILQNLDQQLVDCYSRVLLNLVDNSDLESVAKTLSEKRSSRSGLQNFVKVCLLILVPHEEDQISMLKFDSPNLSSSLMNLLAKAKPKREDQKLRMTFNSAFKTILNSQPLPKGYTNFKAKNDLYLGSFPRDRQDELRALLNSAKYPSKKKLKKLFTAFPEVAVHLLQILENKAFIEVYRRKRTKLAKKIAIKYLSLDLILEKDCKKATQILLSSFKAFPWAIEDVESSCGTLSAVARKVMPLNFSQSMANLKPITKNSGTITNPAKELQYLAISIDEADQGKETEDRKDFSFILQIVQSPFVVGRPFYCED